MRSVRVLGAALLAIFAVASPSVWAAQDKTARGTVTAMTGELLTVRVGASDMKFNVDTNTILVASGAGTQSRRSQTGGVKLADFIRTGHAVVVSYRETGSTMYATRVQPVTSAGPAGGAPTSSAPSTKIN